MNPGSDVTFIIRIPQCFTWKGLYINISYLPGSMMDAVKTLDLPSSSRKKTSHSQEKNIQVVVRCRHVHFVYVNYNIQIIIFLIPLDLQIIRRKKLISLNVMDVREKL